ncbi:MAG: formimidoylglutamate deiminase [Polyangiaceae bacterium]|nr:formimidoylglutamate deiminase [Polyangiaceae bacterium]
MVSDKLELPALATAHSHAFQRAMRGDAQRGSGATNDDFWSWRTAMYTLADSLDPQSIYDISRVAYRELYRAGVRTVGEFHYVHHQPGGNPYDDRTVMADQVIRAARAEKLRIGLFRVVYARAGAGRSPEGAQRRFCDPNLDDALADIETLATTWASDSSVRIGVAAHSVRAVPPSYWRPIAEFAAARGMVFHAHVAEQPAEIQACLGETGRRPVELLADHGALGPKFVAVHATHLELHEASLLGQANAMACLCPTTERDLGDGLPNVTALRDAGVRLCAGVDSHVMTDPLEDLRAIDLGERLRTGKRLVVRADKRTPAEELLHMGTVLGAEACGFSDPGGFVEVDLDAPELALVRKDQLLDAIIYSGSTRIFRQH